jgi:hypothetical protein
MKNSRSLRTARLEIKNIKENEFYDFSVDYLLLIYSLESVYTFIPKNACTSLRFSIAVSNGFLKDISDLHWIHKNNDSFQPSKREAAIAKYTFVVLRCPFTRIVSCFFDQVVFNKYFDFTDSTGSKLSLSFHDFLQIVKSQNRFDRNEHWRNQSDFLHYEKYDDYFSLEQFPEAINKLSNKGLKFFDTRNEMKHSLLGLNKVDGNFSKTNELEIKKMKEGANIPSYRSMFDEETINLVKEIYSDDIDLYSSKFGDKDLLFK